MSIIRFGCDSCGHPIEVTDDKIGTNTKCPSCADQLEVPGVRKTSRLKEMFRHKFTLTVLGVGMMCLSLLLVYSPPDASGTKKNRLVRKPPAVDAPSPEMLQQWRDQAEAGLARIATNQLGYQRTVRSICFVNSSQNPDEWSGLADLEIGGRYGTTEQTNIMVRYALVKGLDDNSNVVCFLDGFAMEKRQYEIQLELDRAKLGKVPLSSK